MNARKILLPISVLALAVQLNGATSPSASEKPATDSKSTANPESALKQSMSADAVRQLMGQPDLVKPMKAPSGKAEIWVYKRRVGDRVDRVEVGSIPITVSVIGSDGKTHEQIVGQKVQYGDVHYVTEETVELLMFDDHYVTDKVSRRELKDYR